MKHRVAGRKLTADTQHRIAMRRNLARALFTNGRIVTTQAKAKAVRRFVDRLITRAKRAHSLKDTDRSAFVHQVRLLARDIPDRKILDLLINQIAPMCADRPGGYTRIIRDAKNRLGDNGPRVIWEFVDRPESVEDEEDGKKAKKKGK